MPGEPTAEIPRVDQGIESTTQPPPQRPEAIIPTLNTPQSEQEVKQKEVMTDNDWNEVIALRRKSLAELDNDPTSAARLEKLTEKAKRVLGDGFKQELTARQQQEQEKQRQKTAERNKGQDEALRQMEDIATKGKADMQKIMEDFTVRTTQRQQEVDEKETLLRQEIERTKIRTPEQILQEVLNDPKMAAGKAELDWLDLLSGKQVEGVDPELKRQIEELRKNAMQKIMSDPEGYKKKLQALEAQFYQSRGVNLQNQSKTNSTQ